MWVLSITMLFWSACAPLPEDRKEEREARTRAALLDYAGCSEKLPNRSSAWVNEVRAAVEALDPDDDHSHLVACMLHPQPKDRESYCPEATRDNNLSPGRPRGVLHFHSNNPNPNPTSCV